MNTDLVVDLQAIKRAQTDFPIHPLLGERWSPRAFADRQVERTDMLSLFEAARWSASGGNGQPWSFVVATQAERETYAALAGCLVASNAEWATQAPVLVLGVTLTVRKDQPYRVGLFDLGLAVQNLVVQATSLGLVVHQMGGFSKEAARERFEIPADHEPVVMLAIGHRGYPAMLSEQNRDRELAPRQRKPLDEIVFGERWGETSLLLRSDD
jgi:nitroreductase